MKNFKTKAKKDLVKMEKGEGPSTPQGKYNHCSNEHYGSSGEIFELWVDNRKIAEGSQAECEKEKIRFARDFRIPYEKFTMAPAESLPQLSWTELDGRKFIDLAGVL